MAKANKANKGAVKGEARVVRFETATVKVNVADLRRMDNLTRPEGIKADKSLAVLEASIAMCGVQTPPEVARDDDGGFTLVAGNRRVECVKRLVARGAHDGVIECKVLVDGSAAGRALANLVENEQPGRLEITWLGRFAGYEAMAREGLSVREVAEAVGRAEDVVRDVLRIGKADPRCRAALEADAAGKAVKVVAPVYRHADGKWTATTDKDGTPRTVEVEQGGIVWGVVRLVMRKPVEEQADWLRKVAGLSVAKAQALLNGEGKAPAEKPEGAGEGDEGEGEGEGAAPRVDDNGAVDALRKMAADTLVPALFAANVANGAVAEACADDDIDAARAANAKIGEALAALSKALLGIAGQVNMQAAVNAARAAASK